MHIDHLNPRLENNAGIAIGPILFVVAILAILATAIAAGSSTFATNASQETNRTNAGSMIQIGSSLKMGVDRIVALGTPLANVDINASNTTTNNAIFSPTGGGLVPPSIALAGNTSTDVWMYTWANVPGLGTTALERVAALRVTQGVCDQINVQAGVTAGTPANAALGNIGVASTNFSAFPAAMSGKMVGCVNNTDTGTNSVGWWFYQVLGIQ
jgi:hypothetical protein